MGRKWTEKEREYVKENWEKIPTQVMAMKIDRTESAIKNMARSITKSKVEDKRKKATKNNGATLQKKRQQCKTCIYRAYQGRGCDYILITGERRGCSPEKCDKYTKGKKKKMANEPAWQGR